MPAHSLLALPPAPWLPAQAVTCINLVNQHGSEGQLAERMGAEMARYAAEHGAPLRYVAFDFHKECGAKNYGRWAGFDLGGGL